MSDTARRRPKTHDLATFALACVAVAAGFLLVSRSGLETRSIELGNLVVRYPARLIARQAVSGSTVAGLSSLVATDPGGGTPLSIEFASLEGSDPAQAAADRALALARRNDSFKLISFRRSWLRGTPVLRMDYQYVERGESRGPLSLVSGSDLFITAEPGTALVSARSAASRQPDPWSRIDVFLDELDLAPRAIGDGK